MRCWPVADAIVRKAVVSFIPCSLGVWDLEVQRILSTLMIDLHTGLAPRCFVLRRKHPLIKVIDHYEANDSMNVKVLSYEWKTLKLKRLFSVIHSTTDFINLGEQCGDGLCCKFKWILPPDKFCKILLSEGV
jgi:hypothetical protein